MNQIVRQVGAGTATLCALLTLSGCGMFGRITEESPSQGDPAAERAAEARLGDGERTLLQDYQALLEERRELRDELTAAEDRALRQRERAEAAEHDLDRERKVRIAADAEVERLAERVRELEAQVLSLGIEGAQREQELLRLQIDRLEAELITLTPDAGANPSAPPASSGGSR